MILKNLRMTAKEVSETSVILENEQGQTITIPSNLLPDLEAGTIIYLAIDEKPLVSAEKQAKELLNEIIQDT